MSPVLPAHDPAIPAGFKVLPILDGFIGHNGPIYVRNDPRPVFGFRVKPHMCNVAGTCHGGWIASILDMVMPISIRLRDGMERNFLMTVNLSVDYLSGAREGDWVEGRAELLKRTKRMFFVQGLLTIDGEPIARGSSILRVGGEAPLIEV